MKRTLLILAFAMLVAGCGGSGPRPFLSGGAYRHGVCYGPHRDGQRPGGAEPSAAQIAEDLGIIARLWMRLISTGPASVGTVIAARSGVMPTGSASAAPAVRTAAAVNRK